MTGRNLSQPATATAGGTTLPTRRAPLHIEVVRSTEAIDIDSWLCRYVRAVLELDDQTCTGRAA